VLKRTLLTGSIKMGGRSISRVVPTTADLIIPESAAGVKLTIKANPNA